MKKVELKIAKASAVVTMSGCGRYSNSQCGIGYRNG